MTGVARARRRFPYRLPAKGWLAVLLCCLGSSVLAQEDSKWAVAEDLELRMEVYPVGGRGVTGEPVAVVSWVRNLTDREVEILPCGVPYRHLEVTVRDMAGKELTPPKPVRPALREGGVIVVGPRRTSRPDVYLADRVYKFSTPGTYVLQGALWGCTPEAVGGSGEPTVLAEKSVEYTVREGTAEDQEWIASLLAWKIAPNLGTGRSPAGVEQPELWRIPQVNWLARELAGEMLWSLGTGAALPHLVQFSIFDPKPWSFEGLRKLGTPRAREELEALAKSRDASVAKLAAAQLAEMQGTAGN